ncbi:hypothetical protein GCM10028784_29760 [Myceligenerans cantabricum]
MTVSIQSISAGDGYAYLLRSVVRGDGEGAHEEAVLRYYAEAGTPPGRWLGAGIAEFGSGTVGQGDTVTATQLKRLIGAGLDPVTAQPLGLSFPEMAEIAPRGKVTAGFDLTFSVPKSVSVLWGLADRQAQAMIVAAHHAAISETVGFIEREVAATRMGHNGTVQAEVVGVAAAAYDHWDSRAHDPQLHTHVVVSNKVRTLTDGQWRSLDSRALHDAIVGISEHYNAVLADRLTGTFGLEWEQRDRGRNRNMAWEIKGVPETLVSEFSSRSRDVDVRTDQLIAAHQATHGRRPSARTITRLRSQATLETRPEKELRSLADLTSEWRQRAAEHVGEASTWAQQVISAGLSGAFVADDVAADQVAQVADIVVANVAAKRSTWRHWNLWAEASRQTMGLRLASHEDRERLTGRIVAEAQDRSVRLTPHEVASTPRMLTRRDGSSTLRPKHHAVYSGALVMAAENRLLRRAALRTGPTTTDVGLHTALRRRYRGHHLSGEQKHAVAHIAMSGRMTDMLVGPAGTGKTTAMRALLAAWTYQHGPGSVVGLAPSAAAAKVLAADLGIDCDTVARWLTSHQHGHADFVAGQLVILDEASLAGTGTLDRITAAAEHAGAKILLVGDPAQLQSVDAGGALDMLVDACRNEGDKDGPPTLTGVHRFRDDWEKHASLALRDGHPDVIDTYITEGRVQQGDTNEMTDAAYTTWKHATEHGKASVLVAEAADIVRELNQRARAERILTGRTSQSPDVQLADENRASVGDIVITRRNDRDLTTIRGGFVRNGDRWQITDVRHDGSVEVRRAGKYLAASVVLPADYVAEHLDLGYAVTAHRAQGLTVDSAHVLVTRTTTRENLYVAMTRGRDANHAYVALDQPGPDHTPPVDEHDSARTVLYGVLQHTGAELSAHQTLHAEHEYWTGIARLADEYDTIATLAQRDRWTSLVVGTLRESGRLTLEETDGAVGRDSFWSLCTELRRTEAAGHDVERLLAQVVGQRELLTADDVCAVVHTRLTRATSRRTPARHPAPLIAGLIPPAVGDMPADARIALDECARLIEERARTLAEIAIRDHADWIGRLGPQPADPTAGEAWAGAVATVAAYRDAYGVTGAEPLGTTPNQSRQRRDHHVAQAAVSRAAFARAADDVGDELDSGVQEMLL